MVSYCFGLDCNSSRFRGEGLGIVVSVSVGHAICCGVRDVDRVDVLRARQT